MECFLDKVRGKDAAVTQPLLYERDKMIHRGNGKMTTDSQLLTPEPHVKTETEVSERLDRGGGGEQDHGRGDHTEGDHWGGGRGRGEENVQGRRRIRGRYNKHRGRLRRAQERDEPHNFYLGPTDVNERGWGMLVEGGLRGGGEGMKGREEEMGRVGRHDL